MSWRTFDKPTPPAIGFIELSSIARGIEVTDEMLKAADVTLVLARTICSGKYMVLVAGEVDEVEASVAAGVDVSQECTIDDFIIPNVHPAVFPAVSSSSMFRGSGAIGIIESFSVASLIEAIDQIAKTAEVDVVECRLAMALGGKAYVVFTGDVDAVRYAIDAGSHVVRERGLLVNEVVIPNPRKELFDTLI